MFRISQLFILPIIAVGCNQWTSVESSNSQLKSERASVQMSPGRFVKDLGSIRVNSQHTVTFDVKNDTDAHWTIGQFDTTCVCTVSQASASVIKPHTTESIEIRYRAPGKYAEEYRQVGLKFKEQGTPYLSLIIKANVRPVADAFPPEVNLQRVARGLPLDSYFEVRNFSEADWTSIAVSSDAPWLKTECISTPVNGLPGSPRQKWRVLLQGNTNGLCGGSHKFLVHVRPSHGNEPLAVPVVLEVLRPVEAIPDQVFIPSAERGKTVKHKLSLRFANEHTLKSDKIEVTHNLSSQFKISCNRINDLSWEVCTEWNTDNADNAIISGQVTLIFGTEELPDLVIPVYARVSQ